MVLSPVALRAGTFKDLRLGCHLSTYSAWEVRVAKRVSGQGRGRQRSGIIL